MKAQKYERILYEYEKLKKGKVIIIDELAMFFNVDKRTVHRDILDLRCYLADSLVMNGGGTESLVYDRKAGGYLMT